MKTGTRKISYKKMIKTVADSYPQGFIHGIQKDAIQNGWDAREYTKGTGWRMEFDVISVGDKRFFVIQDFGTVGLTGNTNADDWSDPEDIPEEERWAKFECYGATKEGSDKLGSRGQGKFLFVYASEVGRILYDSLRDDGTYRFGLTENSSQLWKSWDDTEATVEIKKQAGLEPISERGTRIIIENPKKELIDYYRNGFLRAVEETWWPLIKKFRIEIALKSGGKEFAKAEIPPIFKAFSSQKIREELGKDGRKFEYGKKKRRFGKIKQFHIACNDSELDQEFVGIVVFRDGMKVLSIPFDGSPEFNKKIFGYVEFDKRTDEQLREVELPNHYGFMPDPLWMGVESKIRTELRTFARERLGVGREAHPKKIDSQHDRKVKALMASVFNRFDVPIDFEKEGVVPQPKPSPSPPTAPKSIRIYDNHVSYTEDHIKRINYGDTLQCTCKVERDSSKDLRIKIGIYSKTNEIQKFKDTLVRSDDIEVSRKVNKNIEGGRYTIKFQLVRDSNKEILDEKMHALWIEEYPSGKSPFEITRFEGEKSGREWELDYEDRNLNLNVEHSYYKYAQEQGKDFLAKHEAEMGVMAFVDLVVRRLEMDLVEEEQKEQLEKSKLFENLLSELSENDTTKIIAGLLLVQGIVRDAIYGGKG